MSLHHHSETDAEAMQRRNHIPTEEIKIVTEVDSRVLDVQVVIGQSKVLLELATLAADGSVGITLGSWLPRPTAHARACTDLGEG
jgi:hypothetical protein